MYVPMTLWNSGKSAKLAHMVLTLQKIQRVGLWEEPLLWPRLKFLDVVNFLLSPTLLFVDDTSRLFARLWRCFLLAIQGPESEFLNFADYSSLCFQLFCKSRSITFCFLKYCEYKIDILNMSEEEASFACCCMPFKRTWLTQFRLLRLCTNCIACCIQ